MNYQEVKGYETSEMVSYTTLENGRVKPHSKPLNEVEFFYKGTRMTVSDLIVSLEKMERVALRLAQQIDDIRDTLKNEGRVF